MHYLPLTILQSKEVDTLKKWVVLDLAFNISYIKSDIINKREV